MKRSSFAPKPYPRQPKAQLVHVASCNSGPVERAHVPVAKDVKAKPGKRAPTADEVRWMRATQDFGCFACWRDGVSRAPGEYHHVVEAGRRLGHAWGYLLCSPGHHQPDSRSGKISIHPGRRPAFLARYGAEREIVARLRALLGFA